MKDDKYVEEKAKELYDKIFLADTIDDGGDTLELKDFIRTIVEDCKLKVSREDLNFLISLINEDYFQLHGSVGMKQFEQKYEKHIIEFLKEAGVEVEE